MGIVYHPFGKISTKYFLNMAHHSLTPPIFYTKGGILYG
jgi:hypothetical protein